jgi:hypothetical protein
LLTDLNNIIRYREDLLTEVKNLLYHRTDEVELLKKKLEDTDVQLVECMRQVQKMAAEKELKDKELEELRSAAQVVVDMVDPPEETNIRWGSWDRLLGGGFWIDF